MDQKAENGVDFLLPDEPSEPNQRAQIELTASLQGGDGHAAVAQLIGHRTPAVETDDVNVEIRIAVEPDGQFPHNRRRSADPQVGD
jgi:hypothetical protein